MNSAMIAISGSISNNHGTTMCPAMRIAPARTTSSIRSVAPCAITTEKTKCSCGKATFLMRVELPLMASIETVTEMAKNWKGRSPERK